LIECSAPGQKEIWHAAEAFWRQKHRNWRPPSLGLILGCALIQHKTQAGKSLPGTDRLYRIIMSQSAFLIWKLRCERVIQNDGAHHNTQEIRNRWTSTLNDNLKLDQAMTHTKFGKQALKRKIVLRTWSHTLINEKFLPDDWITYSGVLVGINLPEHGRRQREPP
ncbi:hypothetical protein NEOLEDRAFT_1081388, partial [Neolentinus lepideus HHB14362 ss-1]